MKDFIHKKISDFIKESNKSNPIIDDILDKINLKGISSLSIDERNYLNQYNSNTIDKNLENWLSSDDDETFDDNGVKLLYDEFEDDEDIFQNYEKLKRVITKITKQKPYTDNSNWGSGYVWRIKSDDNYTGTFIYLGDDDLVLLERHLNEDDEYVDDVLVDITNPKELYKTIVDIKK